MSKKTEAFYQEHKILVSSMFLIIFILFMASSKYIFFNEDAIQFSCVYENISGYVLTNPPPLCIACISDCQVEMIVSYEDTKICENDKRGFFPGSVTLECEGLNKFIGKEVLVNYNMSYSNISLKNFKEELKIESKR